MLAICCTPVTRSIAQWQYALHGAVGVCAAVVPTTSYDPVWCICRTRNSMSTVAEPTPCARAMAMSQRQVTSVASRQKIVQEWQLHVMKAMQSR